MRTRTSGGVGGARVSPAPTQSPPGVRSGGDGGSQAPASSSSVGPRVGAEGNTAGPEHSAGVSIVAWSGRRAAGRLSHHRDRETRSRRRSAGACSSTGERRPGRENLYECMRWRGQRVRSSTAEYRNPHGRAAGELPKALRPPVDARPARRGGHLAAPDDVQLVSCRAEQRCHCGFTPTRLLGVRRSCRS